MKAYIIDDEPDAIEALHLALLEHCPQVAIAGKFNDPQKGLDAIRAHRPDLVFLDVEMPGISGFQVLEAIGDIDFAIIFTTAHAHFALKAFRFSAVDYLLKPIDPALLIEAVGKAAQQRLIEKLQLDILQKHIQEDSQQVFDKIALPHAQGFIFTDIADILYCESDNSYTKFYLKNGHAHLVTKNLGEVEEMLTERDFFRIHKQFLVNMRQISRYIRGDGGYVIMPNGVQIPVSRVKKEAFTGLFRRF